MDYDLGSQLSFHWATRIKESATTAKPPRLIIRTCRHILESGDVCQAAAVGGRTYCRAHLVLRVRCRKMARARRRAGSLKLPPLIDAQGVQVGVARVKVALAAEHIDPKRARLLRWAMRIAATNLRRIELQQQKPPNSWAAKELATMINKSNHLYRIRLTRFDSRACDRNTS
jgi:hypothetical protein